jgi:hypothetical protein
MSSNVDERAKLAAQEAERARDVLQRLAAQNARLARAVLTARPMALPPERFDPEPWLDLAVRATGLSRENLQAAITAAGPPPEYTHPGVDVRARARRRGVVAGVPELHLRNLVDRDPMPGQAWVAVREFLADDRLGFLVLSGGKGTHKTGSACWMLTQVEGGNFVEAPDLLAVAIEDKARYLRLRVSRYVVLDDLGTEIRDGKGLFQGVLNTLWNGWYAGCAKVITTCNLTAEEFRRPPEKGGYGERIYDRLRERGRWICIGGESRRRAP